MRIFVKLVAFKLFLLSGFGTTKSRAFGAIALAAMIGSATAQAFDDRFQPYFTAEQVSSAQVGGQIGERFFDLAFNDPSGQRRALGDYRGKIVFINFWGAWCPPCRREMPALAELYGRFKDNRDVQFVFFQVGEPIETSKSYVSRQGLDLPVFDSIIAKDRSRRALLASGQEVELREIGIPSYPTTVVLDKNGLVMGRVKTNYHWNS